MVCPNGLAKRLHETLSVLLEDKLSLVFLILVLSASAVLASLSLVLWHLCVKNMLISRH